MEPHKSWCLPAVCGCDFVRDDNGMVVKKSIGSWKVYANRLAEKKSKQDNFQWHGVVSWVEWRDCYRISFGGQPENILRR